MTAEAMTAIFYGKLGTFQQQTGDILIHVHSLERSADHSYFASTLAAAAERDGEYNEIAAALDQLRAYGETEDYIFSVVRAFISRRGASGIQLIQNTLRNANTPEAVRYYLPMLLGYVRNPEIENFARNLLDLYRRDPDRIIRRGADEGLEYAEAV